MAEPVQRARARPFDRITFDPEVIGGHACIRGLRVTVATIVDQIADGAAVEDVLAEYPYLEREDVRQALSYAAWLMTSEETRQILRHTSRDEPEFRNLADLAEALFGPNGVDLGHIRRSQHANRTISNLDPGARGQCTRDRLLAIRRRNWVVRMNSRMRGWISVRQRVPLKTP